MQKSPDLREYNWWTWTQFGNWAQFGCRTGLNRQYQQNCVGVKHVFIGVAMEIVKEMVLRTAGMSCLFYGWLVGAIRAYKAL